MKHFAPILVLVFAAAAHGNTGACCFPDTACTTYSAAACIAAGGVYQGTGVDCGDVACPDETAAGACCLVDDSCDDSTELQCAIAAGVFTPNPCDWILMPQPVPGGPWVGIRFEAPAGPHPLGTEIPVSVIAYPLDDAPEGVLLWAGEVSIGWDPTEYVYGGLLDAQVEDTGAWTVPMINGAYFYNQNGTADGDLTIAWWAPLGQPFELDESILLGRFVMLSGITTDSTINVIANGDECGYICDFAGCVDYSIAIGTSPAQPSVGYDVLGAYGSIDPQIPADCPGDYTGDQVIDVWDLITVIEGWGMPYDVTDINNVLNNWGDCA